MNRNDWLSLVVLSILSLSCLPLWGQASKEEMLANPNTLGGVYYAYPTPSKAPTAAPKGYKPFYISHLGRHGSRYLIADKDYQRTLAVFDKAAEEGKLTALGEDVRARIQRIYADAEGLGGELTPVGVRQQRGIAERMFRHYPEVFKGRPDMTARSTIVPRCILTMDAFCERLKELNPSLGIDRGTGGRYMDYLNWHSRESNEYTSHGPWREQYRAFEQARVHPDRLMLSLFNDPDYVKASVRGTDLLWGLYWMAVDIQDTDVEENLYDIFDPEELFQLWQIGNYHNYMADGPSPGSGGLVLANASHQLRNVLESADRVLAAGKNTADFRFAHDGNVIPFAGLLGLEGCTAQETDPEKLHESWTNWRIVPMAANVQIVFYKDKKGDVLVKFSLNEEEKSIPIGTDLFPFYHWEDVRAFWLKQLETSSVVPDVIQGPGKP